MTKREQDLERALKVATIVIISLSKGADKQDYINRFGEARVKELLSQTEHLSGETVENILFKALYPDSIS